MASHPHSKYGFATILLAFALALIIGGADSKKDKNHYGESDTELDQTGSYPHPRETTHHPSHNDTRCPENCGYSPVECECTDFFQCRDGKYSEYKCPQGLHFNRETAQCDLPESARCVVDPDDCCECKYMATGPCSPDYIFQDRNRTSESFSGKKDCIQEHRRCENGLVWNPEADADGACDKRNHVSGCNDGSYTSWRPSYGTGGTNDEEDSENAEKK